MLPRTKQGAERRPCECKVTDKFPKSTGSHRFFARGRPPVYFLLSTIHLTLPFYSIRACATPYTPVRTSLYAGPKARAAHGKSPPEAEVVPSGGENAGAGDSGVGASSCGRCLACVFNAVGYSAPGLAYCQVSGILISGRSSLPFSSYSKVQRRFKSAFVLSSQR